MLVLFSVRWHTKSDSHNISLMSKTIIHYTIFVLLILLTACAGTQVATPSAPLHTENLSTPTVKINSFIDLDHKSEKYSQPAVWVRIASVEDRLLLENSIIERLRNYGIKPIPGTIAFPPGVKITREMIIPSFQQSGGDSLFIISLKPGSTLYHMAYDATLYDDMLEKVWFGHVVTDQQDTSSTDGRSDELMFDATADEIVEQILKDGIF